MNLSRFLKTSSLLELLSFEQLKNICRTDFPEIYLHIIKFQLNFCLTISPSQGIVLPFVLHFVAKDISA